jgi:(2Fe-2S) ferredoxin
MYSGVGSTYSAIIAAATPDLDDVTSNTDGSIYYGDISSNDPLVAVSSGGTPITTSGGVCVLQPFLVVYGENGLIRNSNANDFQRQHGLVDRWRGDLANTANVSATKFVYGAPVRGGAQAPAGLFWSLDSLVRMTFTNDSRIWQYDTLTEPTSIMSKKCVVELDGKFFWIGTDRFFFYNGVVQELPNDMNQNWFFDNLNYACRNKVWGTKNTRWGEIWWFYPRGNDTECNDAIIYNYRENTWYDAVKMRSAGDAVQTFPFPIWAGGEDSQDTTLLDHRPCADDQRRSHGSAEHDVDVSRRPRVSRTRWWCPGRSGIPSGRDGVLAHRNDDGAERSDHGGCGQRHADHLHDDDRRTSWTARRSPAGTSGATGTVVRVTP